MSWQEQRRAPRSPVEIDARLRLPGQGVRRGLILNLSRLGTLFLAEVPIDVEVGARGQLRLALPTILAWLEPHVEVRRATVFDRPNGQPAQGIGFAFSGLGSEEERAIATCCAKWDSYSGREYPLAAPCQVQGEDELRFFLHHGQLTSGSRERARLNLPAETEVAVGGVLQLRVASAAVRGVVSSVRQSKAATTVELDLIQEWGRDFFLHEARRAR